MPPFYTLAAAAILLLCGGCSVAAEPSEPPPPAVAVVAPCAETVSTPTAGRPPALAQTSSPWFGLGDLWVSLPDYPATVQGETLVLRFPVVTLDDGVPTSERGGSIGGA